MAESLFSIRPFLEAPQSPTTRDPPRLMKLDTRSDSTTLSRTGAKDVVTTSPTPLLSNSLLLAVPLGVIPVPRQVSIVSRFLFPISGAVAYPFRSQPSTAYMGYF